MLLIYISYIQTEEAKNLGIYTFSPIIGGMILFNLVVFIFPQVSLHNHMERAKNSLMEKFEEIYEVKRFQYLDLAFKVNLEDKKILLRELQTLNQMIEEIEGILTWPFNFNQLSTLLFGSFLPFLPLIIEFFLLN